MPNNMAMSVDFLSAFARLPDLGQYAEEEKVQDRDENGRLKAARPHRTRLANAARGIAARGAGGGSGGIRAGRVACALHRRRCLGGARRQGPRKLVRTSVHTALNSSKYRSREMSAVRKLLRMMSRPTSGYFGTTTARATPGLVMITWEPAMRSVWKPAAPKTLTKVRQWVGVILLTRLVRPREVEPEPHARPQLLSGCPCQAQSRSP